MINKWILDNFKSIDKEKNLEFRPLTIFTGANSSGKSTVLQSILLLTQTLQNQIHSRSIVLNGSIKRFGSYEDVVYRRDCKKDIKIGFSLKRNEKKRSHWYAPWDEDVSEVDCRFSVTMKGQKDSLQPALKQFDIQTKDFHGKDGKLTIHKKNEADKAKDEQIIAHCKFPIPQLANEYALETKAKPQSFFGERFSGSYIGVGLSHFLPNYALIYREKSEQYKDIILKFARNYPKFPVPAGLGNLKFPKAFTKRAHSIVDEIMGQAEGKKENEELQKLVERFNKRFSFSVFLRILALMELGKDKVGCYADQLVEDLKEMPQEYSFDHLPIPFVFSGIELVKDYFAYRIKYLGPLREEPRSLYPISSMGSTDVGLKGENTAAVFEINKEDNIPFIDPSRFEDPKSGPMEPKEVTLAEAVNRWLVYLGVAERIETHDKGKMGHELKIITDIEEMEQDLTHVGVGVSQVLPILVMALLAEEDDVIILEQPELHLHPRVQSRLADFFVSMNALGKQCIVETHSEYLINRLRYLVARSDDRKIADDTLIYFVEKQEGHSVYREITINEYGVIEEWPKGFFDEGERLAASIVRAAMEKKEKEEEETDYEE